MILDYLEDGSFFPDRERRPYTCDMWGTVLPASDATEKGSLRVKVNTMKDKEDTFDNVPVLTGYGGKSHGAFFLPEEGDTVRLSFFGGDFRHPVVTGCRFPKDSRIVEDFYGKENLKKAFVAENGSGVFFFGEKGKESIEVSGSESMAWKLEEEAQQITFGDKQQKNYILVDKKKEEAVITSQASIRLECGKSSLELKKDGTIVLQCEKLTLEAKDVQVNGKTKVQVKGQELTLAGSTGVSLTGKGQVKVESKGSLKLSGAMIHLN